MNMKERETACVSLDGGQEAVQEAVQEVAVMNNWVIPGSGQHSMMQF